MAEFEMAPRKALGLLLLSIRTLVNDHGLDSATKLTTEYGQVSILMKLVLEQSKFLSFWCFGVLDVVS